MKNKTLLPYRKRNLKIRELTNSQSYHDYLKSEAWAEIRKRVMSRDGDKCQCCSGKATEVHHTKYTRKNLSGQCIDSLFAICQACHKWIEFDSDGNKLHIKDVRKRVFILRKINKVAEPSTCKAINRNL